MRTQRILSALALFPVAAIVVAQYPSYDMAFVLDRGTQSVHRFDARTGTYFGQIGVGDLGTPEEMAYDRATNRLFVQHRLMDGGGNMRSITTSINPFTGDVLNNFTASTTSTRLHPAQGASSQNTALQTQIFQNTLQVRTFTANGVQGIASLSNEGLPSSFSEMQQFTAQSTSFGGYYLTMGDVVYRYNSSDLMWEEAFGRTATRLQGVNCIDGNRRITCFPSNEQGTVYSEFETVLGYSRGHTQNYALGVREDGTSAVQRSLRGMPFNFPTSTFGDGILVDPIALEVHAAPEPTTLAVMGLGAAALVWRRRRKASR